MLKDPAVHDIGFGSQENPENLCVAFHPQKTEDGLFSLEIGDVLFVLKVDKSGWSRGLNLRTGVIGWYPQNHTRTFDPELHQSKLDELETEIEEKFEIQLIKIERKIKQNKVEEVQEPEQKVPLITVT